MLGRVLDKVWIYLVVEVGNKKTTISGSVSKAEAIKELRALINVLEGEDER
jgi:hypothetical protein